MILVVFLIYWVTRQPDPTPWDVFPEEIANRYHWSIDAAGRWTASLPPLPHEAVEAELFSTLFRCTPQQEISPPAPRKDVLSAPPVQNPLPSSLDKTLAVPSTEHHNSNQMPEKDRVSIGTVPSSPAEFTSYGLPTSTSLLIHNISAVVDATPIPLKIQIRA